MVNSFMPDEDQKAYSEPQVEIQINKSEFKYLRFVAQFYFYICHYYNITEVKIKFR